MSESAALLGGAIVVLRKLLGLTQAKFADLLHRTPTTIVRYENGRAPSVESLQNLRRIASAHGYWPLDRLFFNALICGQTTQLQGGAIDFDVEFKDGKKRSMSEVIGLYAQGRAAEFEELQSNIPNEDEHAIRNEVAKLATRPQADVRAQRYAEALINLFSSEDSDQREYALNIIRAVLAPYMAWRQEKVANGRMIAWHSDGSGNNGSECGL